MAAVKKVGQKIVLKLDFWLAILKSKAPCLSLTDPLANPWSLKEPLPSRISHTLGQLLKEHFFC